MLSDLFTIVASLDPRERDRRYPSPVRAPPISCCLTAQSEYPPLAQADSQSAATARGPAQARALPAVASARLVQETCITLFLNP